MRIILNTSTDSYFNLAAEEYFLANSKGSLFMLWRNAPTVVIGKNQNAYAEINVPYIEQNNINVVRRLSGGGAVFHDLGNINFTFITPAAENSQINGINFDKFTAPVLEALKNIGVNAEKSGRNDITVNGAKISGNAQCKFRQSDGFENILHHGTLLYSSNMHTLVNSLNVRPEKIRSKGITSIRSRVENICNLIPDGNMPSDGKKMSADDFLSYLELTFARKYDAPIHTLTDNEITGITKLREEKYSTWDWNFGKSGSYEKTCGKKFGFGWIEAMLTTNGGIIRDIKIHGDFFGFGDVAEIETSLTGVRYNFRETNEALERLNIENIISGCDKSDILSLLFD